MGISTLLLMHWENPFAIGLIPKLGVNLRFMTLAFFFSSLTNKKLLANFSLKNDTNDSFKKVLS